MMKKFCKGLGIGIGIGLAVYATGLVRDVKFQQEVDRERETFGKGN